MSATTVMTSATPCYGTAPLGAGEPQDRGDERTGVADADEEDVVRDVEAPINGLVHAGDAETPAELPHPREPTEGNNCQKHEDDEIEASPRFEDVTEKRVLNLAIALGRFHATLLLSNRRRAGPYPDRRAEALRAGC